MTYIVIGLVFVLAGTVKGVIGLGLPTISLALLSLVVDLPSAMALMIVPSLVTNIWQMFDGKETWIILKRIWIFLACAGGAVWVGAIVLVRVDTFVLTTILGLLLIIYSFTGITGYRLSTPTYHERWMGPLAGVLNGVLTGMTGSFVVPGVMYLQSLGLSRDSLLQAMGMLFTASTVALALALNGTGLLSTELAVLSAIAVVPAIVGMVLGAKLRRRLSEENFRRTFFLALLLLGLYIFSRGLLSY